MSVQSEISEAHAAVSQVPLVGTRTPIAVKEAGGSSAKFSAPIQDRSLSWGDTAPAAPSLWVVSLQGMFRLAPPQPQLHSCTEPHLSESTSLLPIPRFSRSSLQRSTSFPASTNRLQPHAVPGTERAVKQTGSMRQAALVSDAKPRLLTRVVGAEMRESSKVYLLHRSARRHISTIHRICAVRSHPNAHSPTTFALMPAPQLLLSGTARVSHARTH